MTDQKCPIPNCQVENPHQHGSGVVGPREFHLFHDGHWYGAEEQTDDEIMAHVIEYSAYAICLQKLEDKKERVRELEHAMKQISAMDSFEYEKGGAYRIAEKSLKVEP